MGLLQLGMTDFVGSPREALPSLKSECRVGWGGSRGQKKQRDGEMGLVCKMTKIYINISSLPPSFPPLSDNFLTREIKDF